ncbi:MAG: hypothetical protein Fur0032_00850 [Terrimicrobiaceae bacterium]
MQKTVSIYHANLNYAFLEPHKYEQVIRTSYETILDGHAAAGPRAKFVFEASGFTIDQMAEKCPDVVAKLRALIASGQCEFMGAPYSHPILANIPEEDAYWSCEFSQRTYEKHLGLRAESWWNPECTWMQYVPRAFRKAGAKYLTLDFESYMNCNDKEYAWVEKNRATDIYWGGHMPWYDLDPDCKFLHRPFRDVVPGLHGFCRSDRLVGKYISYFLGKITLEDYLDNVKRWSGSGQDTATVVIADDAEYCGTTGYYYVKYYRDYSRSFEVRPDAREKLDALIAGLLTLGEMATFKEVCETVEPVDEPFFVEDRYAWHRTYADCWGGTPEAKRFDPMVSELRREYKEKFQPITEGTHKDQFSELTSKFWFHCTNSANSDGRWPPPPAEPCEFNRQWVLNEIAATRTVLAEMAEATKDIPLPPKPEMDQLADNPEYGLHFTDKDTQNLPSLSFYELQHALYAAWRAFDHTQGDAKAANRSRVLAVYEEYRRRGITRFKDPVIPG